MTRIVVVAKAPVPGEAKTRLGADLGMEAAADLAAAALIDTVRAAAAAFPPARRHLALTGDLSRARRREEIEMAVAGWDVFPQRGTTFADRLAHAHATVGKQGDPVVQIGMDTPQLTPDQLEAVVATLGSQQDAVLGRANDGGWWVLALRDGRHAAVLSTVAMSTATTYDDTRRALVRAGLRVAATQEMRDVDTLADARAVTGDMQDGEFVRTWRRLGRA